jgi:hypothetical protein
MVARRPDTLAKLPHRGRLRIRESAAQIRLTAADSFFATTRGRRENHGEATVGSAPGGCLMDPRK